MSDNANEVGDLESQAENHSMEQIPPARSIIGSENVEDSTVTDADHSPHTSPSLTVAESPRNMEGPDDDQDQEHPIRPSQDVEELPVVAPTSVPGSTIENMGNDQSFEALCAGVDLPDFKDQVHSRSVMQAPLGRRVVGVKNEKHAAADAAVQTMPGKTDDLPQYKDQVNPSPRESGRVGPTDTASAAAPPQPARNKARHAPWPENENTEAPPVVVEEDTIAEADALLIPATVIPPMADVVIQITDSQVRDEELWRQAVPPPQDTLVIQQQQEPAISRLRQCTSVYWLSLIVVVLVAVTVGGVCGSGKCSRESPSSTDAPAPTPAPTNAAAARETTMVAFINNITLTNKTIAYPPVIMSGLVASEEQALRWLIEDDPLKLAASDRFQLQQRYALLTLLFNTTGNRGWMNSTDWLTVKNECDWFGITCVVAGVRELQFAVEKILMPKNNMDGGIPVDLGLLPNIKVIDLSGNSLSGSLPETIGQWRNLEWFDVRGNRHSGGFSDGFTGTLPESISNWSNLKTFDLSYNSFAGSLPESIGTLSNLKTFDLSFNSFSGSLPDWIGNWSSLESFVVSSNNYRSGNGFTGTLPESIGNWRNLKTFDLSSNSFSSSLPESISNWSNLKTFNLASNSFSGSLPESTGNWSHLESFVISSNSVSGYDGQFTGGFNGTLPSSIGNWTALQGFYASYNAMTGMLPASIGQWTALTDFYISSNSYTGTLPASIGNWSNLLSCEVSYNALTGTIPKSIENWKNITWAYFSFNNFTGTMPTGICDAINGSFYNQLTADCLSEVTCTCCTDCY
jgi:Leucine-rich repeat (LRR) protein